MVHLPSKHNFKKLDLQMLWLYINDFNFFLIKTKNTQGLTWQSLYTTYILIHIILKIRLADLGRFKKIAIFMGKYPPKKYFLALWAKKKINGWGFLKI